MLQVSVSIFRFQPKVSVALPESCSLIKYELYHCVPRNTGKHSGEKPRCRNFSIIIIMAHEFWFSASATALKFIIVFKYLFKAPCLWAGSYWMRMNECMLLKYHLSELMGSFFVPWASYLTISSHRHCNENLAGISVLIHTSSPINI